MEKAGAKLAILFLAGGVLAVSLQGCASEAPAPVAEAPSPENTPGTGAIGPDHSDPNLGPLSGNEAAGDCKCKGAWNIISSPASGNCGNIWHNCPAVACDGWEKPWCKVTDEACSGAKDFGVIIGVEGKWAYCNPAENPGPEMTADGKYVHSERRLTEEKVVFA